MLVLSPSSSPTLCSVCVAGGTCASWNQGDAAGEGFTGSSLFWSFIATAWWGVRWESFCQPGMRDTARDTEREEAGHQSRPCRSHSHVAGSMRCANSMHSLRTLQQSTGQRPLCLFAFCCVSNFEKNDIVLQEISCPEEQPTIRIITALSVALIRMDEWMSTRKTSLRLSVTW